MNKTKTLRRLVGLTLLACTVMAIFALPAVAVSKHSISGTARSDQQWYISAIDRKVPTSNTTIQASFHDLCAKRLYFKLINANTGDQLGSTIVASGNVQPLATKVRAGTLFNNAFRLSADCYSWQDRDFAGYQWY